MKNRDKDAMKNGKTKLYLEYFFCNNILKKKKLCRIYTTSYLFPRLEESVPHIEPELFFQIHYFFHQFNGARYIWQCSSY